MKPNLEKLTTDNLASFRTWININLHAVTWQGRYSEDFELFWEALFTEDVSLYDLIERFEYVKSISKVGPLSSWFNWLEEKFICYVFIHQELSIKDISDQSSLPVAYIANTLRLFFLDVFPHLDNYLNEQFQVSNVGHKNIYFCFAQMEKDTNVNNKFKGTSDDEIMGYMEVTLYEDWKNIVSLLQNELKNNNFNIEKISSKKNTKKYSMIVVEAFLLFVVGIVAILGIKKANVWYEKKLTDDVKIFEPQFKWLTTTLSFFDDHKVNTEAKKVIKNKKDIENINDQLSNKLGASQEEERYEVESEVVLTSWGSLPKDFKIAEYEQSNYEELGRRGYRESRYGSTKVYRVMIRSIDTIRTKQKLNNLLENYNVVKVDNVEPGLAVPGGNYYNLYVPRIHLKEFMANVMEVDEAVLYESRTRSRRSPPGKNKVFIWVKLI